MVVAARRAAATHHARGAASPREIAGRPVRPTRRWRCAPLVRWLCRTAACTCASHRRGRTGVAIRNGSRAGARRSAHRVRAWPRGRGRSAQYRAACSSRCRLLPSVLARPRRVRIRSKYPVRGMIRPGCSCHRDIGQARSQIGSIACRSRRPGTTLARMHVDDVGLTSGNRARRPLISCQRPHHH